MKVKKNQPLLLPGVSDARIEMRQRKARGIMEKEGIAALVVAGSQVNYGSGSHHIKYPDRW